MQYKVIFNGDKNNYETFEDRATAERFAQGYLNAEVIEVPRKAAQTKKQHKEKKQ